MASCSLRRFIKEVIRQSSGPEELKRASEDSNVHSNLLSWHKNLVEVGTEARKGDPVAAQDVPSAPHQSAAFYLMWFLREDKLAGKYLGLAMEQVKICIEMNDECIYAYGTGIPQEIEAIWAFHHDAPITTPTDFSQFLPEDIYVIPYIELMRAIVAREDLYPALNGIADSFRQQNRDHRLHQDASFIDGCGKSRIHWNFRLYTILQYAASAFEHMKATPFYAFDEFIFPNSRMREIDGMSPRDVRIVFGFRDTKKLGDILGDLGYVCRNSDKGLASRDNSKAVWIGSNISLGVLRETLAPLLKTYRHLQYFQLIGSSRVDIAYRTLGQPFGALPQQDRELFIGGDTESARDFHEITPIEPGALIDALNSTSTLKEFHSFVRQLSPASVSIVK